jgi:hypothetical protein
MTDLTAQLAALSPALRDRLGAVEEWLNEGDLADSGEWHDGISLDAALSALMGVVGELEGENEVLRVAFAKKNDEYTMVLGCISTWVEKLPRELKAAIREGQLLVAPLRARAEVPTNSQPESALTDARAEEGRE